MILIKEEFVGGEKWRRAVELGGSDAIMLWLAIKRYCSEHADTEGFIPDEDLDHLPGAPRRAVKALQALIDCGRRLPGGARGPGLVEQAAGGWKLHDYLDHAASPEEIQLRREKARLRQQNHREHKRRELAAVRRLGAELALPEGEAVTPAERDSQRDGERDSDGTSRGIARPPEGAREPAPVRGRARPNPTQPNPTKKYLSRLANGIRDPRARAVELVEACAAHRQFAAEHGLDVEPLLASLRAAPDVAALSADEIRARLGALLEAAAAVRSIGGAA